MYWSTVRSRCRDPQVKNNYSHYIIGYLLPAIKLWVLETICIDRDGGTFFQVGEGGWRDYPPSPAPQFSHPWLTTCQFLKNFYEESWGPIFLFPFASNFLPRFLSVIFSNQVIDLGILPRSEKTSNQLSMVSNFSCSPAYWAKSHTSHIPFQSQVGFQVFFS